MDTKVKRLKDEVYALLNENETTTREMIDLLMDKIVKQDEYIIRLKAEKEVRKEVENGN